MIKTNASPSHVWGDWGILAAAHEYGHAVHEKALGGIPNYSCPDHIIDGAYNLACAMAEGSANYHGAAVRGDLASYLYRTRFEQNYYYPGCVYSGTTCTDTSYDGSIIEGAVAAFLYDLTDPANEAADSVEYPGSYVAAIVSTCEWYNPALEDWYGANGVDHYVYCLENQVDTLYASPYFTTRGSPPLYMRESATEPNGWDPTDIRILWLYDLFVQE